MTTRDLSRATVLVAALGACSACAEGSLQPTNEPAPSGVRRPPLPPLGACVDASQGPLPAEPALVEGRVLEVGLGLPYPGRRDRCPLGSGLIFGGSSEATQVAQTSWLRVLDADNREVSISALAEGFAFPLVAGDGLRARIAVEWIGLSTTASSFEARSGDGGLLLWMGSGASLSDLQPPSEVALSLGEVEAEIEDACVGSYRVRSVNVTIEGTTVPVRSGARVEAGPWMLVNAVTQEQTGQTACPDAFADWVQVAIWTRDGQVPESGGMGGPCYPDLPIEQAVGAPEYRCLPDGTLTRECGRSAPCPGVSECVEGFCVSAR